MPLLPAAANSRPLIGNALQRLCSMKNQVQFTPHVLETWLAALSVFPPECVNQAVVEIGLSLDPFPDVGKIALRADELRRIKAGTTAQGEKRLGTNTIKQVAEALGIPF